MAIVHCVLHAMASEPLQPSEVTTAVDFTIYIHTFESVMDVRPIANEWLYTTASVILN